MRNSIRVSAAGEESSGCAAFRALRHYSPEAVRNLRLALDFGATPGELKRLVRGPLADRLRAAIDWMEANPQAGVVVWDGQNYIWAEEADKLRR